MDSFLENGMPPEECARCALDAIHARKREVLIADGVARRDVFLKRWSPAILTWLMQRRKPAPRTIPADRTT
jgi:hypothetical protein